MIKYTDFKSTDLDSDRFDAMIAEIRTIIHLNSYGFTLLSIGSSFKPLSVSGYYIAIQLSDIG